jgi:hypothetical protein
MLHVGWGQLNEDRFENMLRQWHQHHVSLVRCSTTLRPFLQSCDFIIIIIIISLSLTHSHSLSLSLYMRVF